MAQSDIQSAHKNPAATFLFPSLALACFLTWLLMGFTANVGFPFLSPFTPVAPRVPFSWSLSMIALVAVMAAVYSFCKSRTKQSPHRPRIDTFTATMSTNARIQSVVAACFMVIGSIPMILSADHGTFIVFGGVLAAMGVPFVILSWYPAAVRHTPASSLFIATFGALGCLIISTITALLNSISASLLFICMPILVCIFTWISIKQCATFELTSQDIAVDNPPAETLFDAQGILILAALASGFMAFSTVGSVSVSDSLSIPWWVVLGTGISALIVLGVAHIKHSRTQFIAFNILVAANVIAALVCAVMGNAVLLALFSFSSVLLTFALLMRHFCNIRDDIKFKTPDFIVHCESYTIWALFAIIVGCMGGDFLHMQGSSRFTPFILLAAILIYTVVVCLVLLSTKKTMGSHTISQKFDNPEDAARARCKVLVHTYKNLSAREADIITQMLLSCEEAQIAEKLSISPSTVRGHIERIYTKMGVDSREGFDAIADKVKVKK